MFPDAMLWYSYKHFFNDSKTLYTYNYNLVVKNKNAVDIYVIAIDNPKFVETQIRLFDKHLKDEYSGVRVYILIPFFSLI